MTTFITEDQIDTIDFRGLEAVLAVQTADDLAGCSVWERRMLAPFGTGPLCGRQIAIVVAKPESADTLERLARKVANHKNQIIRH